MRSPKAGNHNDLYEIEEVLKEILALLEEAGIEHKGLFLNADAGFDSKSLREFLESKEIIANIKPNPRNGEQPDYYKHEKYITLHSITNCYPNLCARSATWRKGKKRAVCPACATNKEVRLERWILWRISNGKIG